MSVSVYSVPDYDVTKYTGPDNKLGAVLMDVDASGIEYSDAAKEAEYISDDPELFFVKGIQGTPHLTVLYGILPEVPQEEVERLLKYAQESYDGIDVNFKDGEMPFFRLKRFSNFGRNDYDCWVAEAEVADMDALAYVRGILGFAPHINTFHEYKPHITIGYFKKEAEIRPTDFYVPDWMEGTKFRLGGIYNDN